MIGIGNLDGIDRTRIKVRDWGVFGKGYQCTGADIHQGGQPNYFERFGNYIKPDDQKRGSFKVAQSFERHYLLPGEILLDLEPRSFIRPRPELEAWVLDQCDAKYNLDRLHDMPRVRHLLGLYENRGDPGQDAQGSNRTFWWHHQHRRHRWGADKPDAFESDGRPHWYYGILPLSEPGVTTHYNTVLWLALAYLLCEDEETKQRTWTSAMWMALACAAYGMHREGDHAGLFHDEGGVAFNGENKLGWWAKQTHFDGLVVMWALSGHPLLREAVFEHIDAIINRPLTQWDGYGERIPGWFLINAWTAFQITGDQRIAQKAANIIGQLIREQDHNGRWGTKPGAHSDWMIGKILSGCRCWLSDNDPRWNAIRRAALASTAAVDWTRGHPYVPYRYDPADYASKDIHPTTHPALISMAARHAGMTFEAQRLENAVEYAIGANWEDVGNGTVPSLDEIGWAAGKAGSGGLKVPPQILTGLFL